MQTRSYEFYEVRVGRAFDVTPACHGSLDNCERWLSKNIDPDKESYVVRVQVVYAVKPDED